MRFMLECAPEQPPAMQLKAMAERSRLVREQLKLHKAFEGIADMEAKSR